MRLCNHFRIKIRGHGCSVLSELFLCLFPKIFINFDDVFSCHVFDRVRGRAGVYCVIRHLLDRLKEFALINAVFCKRGYFAGSAKLGAGVQKASAAVLSSSARCATLIALPRSANLEYAPSSANLKHSSISIAFEMPCAT